MGVIPNDLTAVDMTLKKRKKASTSFEGEAFFYASAGERT